MVKNRIIKSVGQFEYLKDFMLDLPDNVMFDKVITGCGMTYLALHNKVKYVIAVPYVSLIKNKVDSCKKGGINLCDVYHDGKNEDDILAFTGNKIITTYDSLGKVTEALDKRGDLKNWKLFIDESHKLVDSALFRPRAIRSVLDNYNKYKSFVFGTATPVENKYQLPALRHIPIVRMDWSSLNREPFRINYHQYSKGINDVVTAIALSYLNDDHIGGKNPNNAHFFINSVKNIVTIIKKLIVLGYGDHTKFKIVCAENSTNESNIKNQLESTYRIALVGEPVAKINFYTSTAFEGCDINDDNGQPYIIVDGAKDYTKINIATILPQILGRIKKSKRKKALEPEIVVELVYSSKKLFTRVSERDFEMTIKEHLRIAKNDVKALNGLDINSPVRKKMTHDNDDIYVSYEDDKFVVNENAQYTEMHNFKAIHHTYCTGKNGIQEGQIKHSNGSTYIFTKLLPVAFCDFKTSNASIKKTTGKSSKQRKPSFRDLVNSYDLINKENNTNKVNSFMANIKRSSIDEMDSLVARAINQLGIEKIEKLGYRKPAIEKELLIRDALITNSSKIVSFLKLRTGRWISRADAKLKLQAIYKDLNIYKTAKATDLYQWYSIREESGYVGKVKTIGFTIISCNIKEVKL